MLQSWQKESQKKYLYPEELKKIPSELKRQGKTIVTINGAFDLLHAGHLAILFEASQQADILIVALNTDDSIKRYKSGNRPIIPLEERVQMVAAFEFVDYVTWFDETNPQDLLLKICPNVHVNGAEYGKHCIEAEIVKACGGRVHVVELLHGFSSTKLIEKMIACV